MNDHHGYRLRIYCGGNYGGGYQERVNQACRNARDVELSPFVGREAFVQALARSSYFMALSSLEGRSLAMLEALAMGNALIVADTPENREFIPSSGNFFIGAAASEAETTRALESIVSAPPPAPAFRQSNSLAGRSRSWDDVRRECESLYASV
jgi:glycosyltransferase involved in cell wall biosynthesis